MNPFKMLCIMMLASLTALAQNEITGKVIRKDSSAVVTASVNIIGTNIQVNSNVIGDFTILIPDSLADKEIVLFVSKKGYLSTQKVIDTVNRQGKPVIIMLTKLNAESAAPPSPLSPPPPTSPPPTPTTSSVSSPTTTSSAPPARDGEESLKSLPPGQQVPMFPWPPPEYSVSAILDKSYFKESKTMFNVDDILTAALSDLGYDDRSYFEIPNGFALVTRIEQIQEDGKPLPSPARWSVRVRAYDRLSWSSYLKALVFPPSGFFRIIVFAVTDNAFTSSYKKATRAAAEQWLKSGINELPASIGNKSFGPNHLCSALIYEFKKVESKQAEQITGELTGTEHLQKSGLIPLVKEN